MSHVDDLIQNGRAIDELVAVLTQIVDGAGDEPCRLDHHGNCQTHNLEKDCWYPKAKALIAKHGGAK